MAALHGQDVTHEGAGAGGLRNRRDRPNAGVEGESLNGRAPATAAGFEGTLGPVRVKPGLDIEAEASCEGSNRLERIEGRDGDAGFLGGGLAGT